MDRMNITLIIFLVCSSFLSNEILAEWELSDEIYLGYGTGEGNNNELISCNPLTNRIYIAHDLTENITVLDAESLSIISRIQLSDRPASSGNLLIDRVENLIYVAYGSNLSVIDGNTNKIIKTYENEREILSFTIDFSHQIIIVSSRKHQNESSSVKIIDSTNFTQLTQVIIDRADYTDTYISAVTVDQNTHRIYATIHESSYSSDKDGILFILDGDTYETVSEVAVGLVPKLIAINDVTGYVYVCNEKSRNISVIDSKSNQVVKTINNVSISLASQIAIDQEKNLIYVNSKIISGITYDSLNEEGTIRTLNNFFKGVCIDELNGIIYICRQTHVKVFDSGSFQKLHEIVTSKNYASLNILPSINSLYIGSGMFLHDGNQVTSEFKHIDLGNKKIVNSVKLNVNSSNEFYDYGYNIYNNSKNGLVYISSSSGYLFLYNPETNDVIRSDSIGETDTNEFVIDEDNERLYVAYHFSPYIHMIDANTLEKISTYDTGLKFTSNMRLDSVNELLYVVDNGPDTAGSSLVILDSKTYEVLNNVEFSRNVLDIEVFPNGGKLYVSFTDGDYKIHIFDTITLEDIGTINVWAKHMRLVEYAGDEMLMVTDDDGISFIDLYSDAVMSYVPTNTNSVSQWNEIASFNPITGIICVLYPLSAKVKVFKETAYQVYIPPSSPTSLTVTTESAITITWPPVDHSDVQGYIVHRSPAGADQWTKLNTELVTHTSFLDETAVPNTPYDYHVSTTGLYNISSDPSEPATVTLTIDPGFSISSVLASQSTEQGTSIDYIITSESIEQFATLIDLTVNGLPEGINSITATFTSDQLRPGDVTSLTLDIPENVITSKYEFDVVGNADGIEQRVPLTLNVVETEQEESALTLSLSSNSIEYGDAIFATGRIIPAVTAPVSLVFTSSSEIRTVSATSLSDGTFSLDFEPESSGEWTVLATWAGNDDYSGAESELKVFDALSGQTKITCTTDVSADAEVGWQMTVKGTVFPNPGVGDVVLYVTKPDGAQETIDGLKINELGYYGYNITADQPGFWEVTAGWAGNIKYLGSVSETLIVPYGLDIGRAIIVVSPKQNRPFYYTANRLGNLAYQTFSKRRFDNPRIKYFDIDTTQDLNGDGFSGDVDGEPTLANVTEAISTWAAAAVNEETPLCIYLIGEGSLDGIELSDGNLLTASHLADLLSDVESTTGCDDVIVVVDAPHSGKFVSELSKLGRCVVTSTNLGKSNYIGHGKLSFSQYFLNYAYQGKSLRDSFLYTKRVLSNLPGAFKKQEPQVEGEGNVFANESSDFLKTANWYFGSSYGLQDLMPRVKSMSLASVTGQGGGVGKIVTNTHDVMSDEATPSLKLAKSVAAQGVDVWVRVDDAESNISSVFATVFSPQDSVLQEVELYDSDSDGKYDGVVYGLDDIGAYDIVAYAFDESENVSEPMKSLVMVVEREVVLEPPTDVRVDDMPDDNGYHVKVSWDSSPSEENGDVGWYRIYRSRKDELTSPIPLSQFTSIDTLNYYEESYTILVDSVTVGQAQYVDSVPLIGVNYYYWVDANGPTGSSKKMAADTPTVVETTLEGFVLHQPYPNPFNPSTTIHYELPVESHIEFVVYDVLGRKVKVLEDRVQEAGSYDVVWDGIDGEGMDVGSGMYFYQMKAGEVVRKGKMVLVR